MKIYKYLILVCFIIISSCSSGGSDDPTPQPTADTTAPTAPTNLTKSNTTITSVDLSWTASTDNIGVKNYSIYKDDTDLVTTSSVTHTVSGLTANTTYAFKVKAKDAAGNESGFGNIVNVKTDDNTATLVTTSGDIEIYIGSFY